MAMKRTLGFGVGAAACAVVASSASARSVPNGKTKAAATRGRRGEEGMGRRRKGLANGTEVVPARARGNHGFTGREPTIRLPLKTETAKNIARRRAQITRRARELPVRIIGKALGDGGMRGIIVVRKRIADCATEARWPSASVT